MISLTERFFRYVTIDTRADESAKTTPSSPGQRELALLLADEIRALGFANVAVDDHAYLVAHVPGRGAMAGAPRIGLLAHLDTAIEYPGGPVRPRRIQYTGGIVPLGNGSGLDPAVFPVLVDKIGKTLLITDGSTLLGGDDKAGIAVIMTVLAELAAHPDRAHPPLSIAFTPDEEIGHGASLLDIDAFGADFAFTVDGGGLGTIEFENFNAASATVTIRGRSIHPGEAKGKMINAILLGQLFLDALPADERPDCTEQREGFYHVDTFNGTVESARITLLVRNHEANLFEKQKARLQCIIDDINRQFPAASGETPRVELAVTDQYRNMVEKIQPHMHIVQTAEQAMRDLGIQPIVNPIRGGTDGARLSWRGLPCPNLFFGGYNMHGPFEFVVEEEMQAAVRVILAILDQNASRAPA